MHLMIDADILVYKCAFSVEEVSTSIQSEQGRTPVKDVREARKIQNDDMIVKETYIAPFSHAAANLRSMIDRIVREVTPDSFELVLSSSKKEVNRRNRIARILPYKVDRPPKPFHYEALRKYIIEEFNTIVVEEGEADDYLGAKQNEQTIIASIDKDLLQIPGRHFDINSSAFTDVTALGQLSLDSSNKLTGNGFKWFCAQCLLGDRTDAIRGIPYIRQVKVSQLLAGAETAKACWERVVKEYQENKHVPLDFWFVGETEEQARKRYMKEMAQLVWIAHSDDDYYRPNIDGEYLI